MAVKMCECGVCVCMKRSSGVYAFSCMCVCVCVHENVSPEKSTVEMNSCEMRQRTMTLWPCRAHGAIIGV